MFLPERKSLSMATVKTTGSQFDVVLAPRKRAQVEELEAPKSRKALVGTDDTAPLSRSLDTNTAAKSTAKSRDDAYQGRTFYVRKKTYAECGYFLKSTDDERDMSDLVEELLTEFIAKHSTR
jgi:hypothetical protein